MIQIIEDDPVTCHILSTLLQRLRYTYCEAHTGEEAMQQLKSCPIDLVIADMGLPDTNGLQLLAAKHALPYLRDIPVLCCTAQADIETVEAALGYGAIDFVKKPIMVQPFAARVNRALERAPVRWESWREMNKRLRFSGRSIQPMLAIAQQVLRELEAALSDALTTETNPSALNALVARARGAAANVGALRTVQQIDRLWHGQAATQDIEHLRAALIIEQAAFDEAIAARAAMGDTPAPEQIAS
jgi:PleD family two-component response regulator